MKLNAKAMGAKGSLTYFHSTKKAPLKILIFYNEGIACTGLEATQLANDLRKRTNGGFAYFGKQVFTCQVSRHEPKVEEHEEPIPVTFPEVSSDVIRK